MKTEVGQIIPVYEIVSNEQDEPCNIGKQYPSFGNFHDCKILVKFNYMTQFYMYEYEIKPVFYLRVTKIK